MSPVRYTGAGKGAEGVAAPTANRALGAVTGAQEFPNAEYDGFGDGRRLVHHVLRVIYYSGY
jgi:hypothetical protein